MASAPTRTDVMGRPLEEARLAGHPGPAPPGEMLPSPLRPKALGAMAVQRGLRWAGQTQRLKLPSDFDPMRFLTTVQRVEGRPR